MPSERIKPLLREIDKGIDRYKFSKDERRKRQHLSARKKDL